MNTDTSKPAEAQRKRAERIEKRIKKQEKTVKVTEAPTEEEPTEKVTAQPNNFDKYPAPITEQEFEGTISHIPTNENKILYFETMMRRIKDDKLAGKIYTKWGEILYK